MVYSNLELGDLHLDFDHWIYLRNRLRSVCVNQ